MSLTINKQPTGVCLLKDGLVWQLETDNLLSAEGDNAELRLQFPDTANPYYDDKYFELEMPSGTITITFKSEPDESGVQVNTRADGQSLEDFMIQLKEDLQKNYTLYKYYKISNHIDGDSVIFYAQEKGTTYNIALGDDDIDTITETKTEGVDIVTRENFKILMQVFEKGSEFNQSTLLGTDAIYPAADQYAGDNITNFDLHEYCEDILETSFLWPEVIGTKYQKLTDAAKEIFFRYGEMFGGEVKSMADTYDSPVVILPGGTSWRDKAFYNEFSASYYSYNENAKRFLTWAPLEKLTSKTASEKLYFYFDDGYTIDLKCKLTYTDDTTETFSPVDGLSVEAYEVLEFLLSYKILELADKETAAGKSLKKYEVWIEDSGSNILSETRTFVIDQQYHFKEHRFLYKNSFGFYDAIRATGVFEKTNEYDRTLIEVEDGLDYTYQDRQKKDVFIDREQTFKGNFGFVSKEMKNYLNEFIGSGEIYEMKGDLIFPIVITSKKIFQHSDDETLYDMQFEYNSAYSDESFSRQLPDEDVEYLLDESDEILTDSNGAPLMEY